MLMKLPKMPLKFYIASLSLPKHHQTLVNFSVFCITQIRLIAAELIENLNAHSHIRCHQFIHIICHAQSRE